VGKPEKIHHWEDLGEDGTIILKWIIISKIEAWTELISLRTGTSSGLL
jgi:hypothetical protein